METEVLVLAATKYELEGVLTKLGEPIHIGEHSVVGVCTGVGKVQSALAALKALYVHTPRLVVLLGYAGALDPCLDIADLVVATKVVQYDLDLRAFGLQRGQTFDGGGKIVPASIDLYAPDLNGSKKVVLGTADRFLLRSYREQNPYLTEELGLGASDMEGFGIAQACVMRAIPCAILRVISDDAKGHRPKDFKRFVRQANERLRDGLLQLLEVPKEKSPTSLYTLPSFFTSM